jgi:hypothetical protein
MQPGYAVRHSAKFQLSFFEEMNLLFANLLRTDLIHTRLNEAPEIFYASQIRPDPCSGIVAAHEFFLYSLNEFRQYAHALPAIAAKYKDFRHVPDRHRAW